MQKINLLKNWKPLYAPSAKEAAVVEVPSFQYLMIEGEGDPNTVTSYQEAIETLFAVSYAAKFNLKKSERAIDYGVIPLQCLWQCGPEDF